jgi:hypothetical protein
MPKFILIVLIIIVLAIFVAPRVIEIINDERRNTEERSRQGEGSGHNPRQK